MKAIGDQLFCDAFMQGQRDCEAGIPHTHEKAQQLGPAYTRGYSTQYELEQVRTWRSEHGTK